MSMTMNLRALVIGLLLIVASTVGAFAQCSGSAPASTYCGNPTGALALPGWKPFSGIPFPNIAGGTVVGNRGTATGAAAALTNPVLGIPGTSSGQLGFAGSAGGTATIVPQATAGSPVLTLPNTSGTFAVGASAPLALSATTGALTCATCVTSSGGGAITGTAPISVSAAGVVSINAPYGALTASNGGIVYSGATNLAILAGTVTARQMLQSGASSTPAWSTSVYPATSAAGTILASLTANTITASSNPVLGIAGSVVGDLGFQNASTGTVTLRPVTGALGSAVVLIPNASGTMAVSVSAPITLNALTGALACATCVTSSGGGAITGTAPISVSAAGVVSITSPLPVSNGGTALASGTSGGILGFTASGTIASSVALTANAIVLGGGAGATPTVLGSLGTTTTLLHGNAAGAPTFGQVVFADIATAAISTGANYLAGTSSNTLIPPNIIYQPEVTITFGATQSLDFSTFINGAITMTANTTTQNVSNVTAGKAGQIAYIQSGAGSFTTVFNSIFKFAGGAAPSLTTGSATAVDLLVWSCRTATNCPASLIKDVR